MKQDDLIHDRYKLEHPLGKGGMAEVWCARDRRLERSVAIKFLSPQLHADPEWLVRFFAEAQGVARISHPNVVSVLDFGEHDARPYLVMEHLPGGSLADIAGEPVLPERALELVRDAALGAGAVHSAGLVHRDIKPGNILLSADGRATLCDFGIAASSNGERLTATGLAIGSPHYVSPEQAAGRQATPASDVYSLGVVLYELLTGLRPFDAENATAIAIAHVEKEPDPPSTHVQGLDPAIDALVLRCLAKDPRQRFDNGDELAAALDAPHLVAARASFATDDDEEESGYWIAPPPWWRRVATTIGILALVIGLAVAAVWASSRTEDPPRELSRDLETEDLGADETPKRKPAPSPTGEGILGTTSIGDPAPSPSDAGGVVSDEPDDTDDGPTVEVVDDNEPDEQPSPEPTEEPPPSPEPTSEPTPAPTTEQQVEDGSGGG